MGIVDDELKNSSRAVDGVYYWEKQQNITRANGLNHVNTNIFSNDDQYKSKKPSFLGKLYSK